MFETKQIESFFYLVLGYKTLSKIYLFMDVSTVYSDFNDDVSRKDQRLIKKTALNRLKMDRVFTLVQLRQKHKLSIIIALICILRYN